MHLTQGCVTPTALQEQYGGLYSEANVAMSGTHTHSGPGGYLQYILYIITSLGFVRESFDVLVGGILEARQHGTCRASSSTLCTAQTLTWSMA
jgi:hypothetical protein